MKTINYLLNGFGYENLSDLKRTCCGVYIQGIKFDVNITIVAVAGFLKVMLPEVIGFDWIVLSAFVFLIAAEFQTGLKVSRRIRKERFKSRPFTRMIVKIGVYASILIVLNQFAKKIDAPDIMGISLNPFVWLYYTVLIAIVFQLLISWLENLGMLGYKETRTIAGFILRKFNAWFEFDGSKNNTDNEGNNS
jgi:hypothetical protein